jgi:hypothetical protein
MNLFVKQLKALKTTMSTVGPEQFDMGDWHCGTIACVCGHQATKDLNYFPIARETKNHTPLATLAKKVSDDLDDACEAMFGTSLLSKSIWDSEDRQLSATLSKLFTRKQINHPHLTTDSSPADVVSYIDMLLGLIDVYETA